jgi:hypothetical protein
VVFGGGIDWIWEAMGVGCFSYWSSRMVDGG